MVYRIGYLNISLRVKDKKAFSILEFVDIYSRSND